MEFIVSYQVRDFNLPIAADAIHSRGIMGDAVPETMKQRYAELVLPFV